MSKIHGNQFIMVVVDQLTKRRNAYELQGNATPVLCLYEKTGWYIFTFTAELIEQCESSSVFHIVYI